MTTKGELVRSILFPPPLDFQFHRDFLKSIYVFLTLGLIGMAYSLTMWIRNGVISAILTFSRVNIWHYGSPLLRVAERAEVFTEIREPKFDFKKT